MWDTFDTTMEISMITTIIAQILMVIEKIINTLTTVWDLLFPSEPSTT